MPAKRAAGSRRGRFAAAVGDGADDEEETAPPLAREAVAASKRDTSPGSTDASRVQAGALGKAKAACKAGGRARGKATGLAAVIKAQAARMRGDSCKCVACSAVPSKVEWATYDVCARSKAKTPLDDKCAQCWRYYKMTKAFFMEWEVFALRSSEDPNYMTDRDTALEFVDDKAEKPFFEEEVDDEVRCGIRFQQKFLSIPRADLRRVYGCQPEEVDLAEITLRGVQSGGKVTGIVAKHPEQPFPEIVVFWDKVMKHRTPKLPGAQHIEQGQPQEMFDEWVKLMQQDSTLPFKYLNDKAVSLEDIEKAAEKIGKYKRPASPGIDVRPNLAPVDTVVDGGGGGTASGSSSPRGDSSRQSLDVGPVASANAACLRISPFKRKASSDAVLLATPTDKRRGGGTASCGSVSVFGDGEFQAEEAGTRTKTAEYWINKLNLTRILAGANMRKEFNFAAGCEERLRLGGEKAKAAMLKKHMVLVSAAMDLTPARIPNLEPSDLKHFVKVLKLANIDLPIAVKVALWVRRVRDDLEGATWSSEDDPALLTVCARSMPYVVGDVDVEDSFDPEEPALSACEGSPADKMICFRNTFIHNLIVKPMYDGEAKCSSILRAVCALTRKLDDECDSVSQDYYNFVEGVSMMLKCLTALLDESSVVDDDTLAAVGALEVAGRSAEPSPEVYGEVSIALCEHSMWLQKVTKFRRHCWDTIQWNDRMQAWASTFDTFGTQLMSTRIETLKDVTKHLPDIIERVRPGVVDNFIGKFSEVVEDCVKEMLSKVSYDEEHTTQITECLDCLKTLSGLDHNGLRWAKARFDEVSKSLGDQRLGVAAAELQRKFAASITTDLVLDSAVITDLIEVLPKMSDLIKGDASLSEAAHEVLQRLTMCIRAHVKNVPEGVIEVCQEVVRALGSVADADIVASSEVASLSNQVLLLMEKVLALGDTSETRVQHKDFENMFNGFRKLLMDLEAKINNFKKVKRSDSLGEKTHEECFGFAQHIAEALVHHLANTVVRDTKDLHQIAGGRTDGASWRDGLDNATLKDLISAAERDGGLLEADARALVQKTSKLVEGTQRLKGCIEKYDMPKDTMKDILAASGEEVTKARVTLVEAILVEEFCANNSKADRRSTVDKEKARLSNWSMDFDSLHPAINKRAADAMKFK